MKHILLFGIFSLFFLISARTEAQNNFTKDPERYFASVPELYFRFEITGKEELEVLTRIVSIDNVAGNIVYAYANRKEFNRFLELGYSFTVLPHPGRVDESILHSSTPAGDGKLTTWDFYPNYDQYIDFMNGFASSYPDICELVPIGTSIQGRQLIAVKISDNVNLEEAEPQILYTSSIHGDELTGYVLMLHLIDYLLQNYSMNPRIQAMIDSKEIFINPLANPDGTFFWGNQTVNGAQRYNANGIDLNRNYPDPEDGPHPDGNDWQVETVAFMAFADSNHFVLSSNFHGGAEVFNYPWDTWAKLAADDSWWQFVGHEYVDTVYLYSPASYFSGFNNGISNGYQWYTISGGRQDYMNYFQYCREVTLEISDIKLIPASQLLSHWNYNYRSLLNYIDEAGYGVQGIVTDSVTGEPLRAKVFAIGHDIDNSFVYSKLPSGHFARLLDEGSYVLHFTRFGYEPKDIEVDVLNRETTLLDVKLVPVTLVTEKETTQLSMLYPNPARITVRCELPEKMHQKAEITCYNATGRCVFQRQVVDDRNQGFITLDIQDFHPGLYVLKLETEKHIYTDRLIVD